ncbi:MAG: c-type cytochrome [Novosphingobium sp.]|nr:c-type cytochrome [Novosphingobium sp.]
MIRQVPAIAAAAALVSLAAPLVAIAPADVAPAAPETEEAAEPDSADIQDAASEADGEQAIEDTAETIAQGKAFFQASCQSCHSAEAGKPSLIGPNLAGVVGRAAASSDFPRYSPALQAAGVTWTRENLDQYLTSPTAMVPGTRMAIPTRAADKRTAIIAFLASTAAEPAAE